MAKIFVSHGIVSVSGVMPFVEVNTCLVKSCNGAHKTSHLYSKILTFYHKERDFNFLVVSYDK